MVSEQIKWQAWHGARPILAPAGTITGPRGNVVDIDIYALSVENFERAENAIALCLEHGLLPVAR